MRSTIIRWTLYCIALFAAGPAAGFLVGMIRASDGSVGSPLVSTSPVMGLILAVAALAIAGVVGMVAGRIVGPAAGMTAAGIVVAWAAWKSADTDDLIRTMHSGSPLARLAAEGAVLGAIGFAVSAMCLMAGPSPKQPRGDAEGLISINGLLTIVVGVAAGGVAAWLIAATPLKGQAVFAAIAAGTLSAAAARLVDIDAPMNRMFIPIALLALLSPLIGLVLSGNVVATAYKGGLFPLASISPLDWIAGGLIGIPWGVSWAGSMIEKRVQEVPTTTPAQ